VSVLVFSEAIAPPASYTLSLHDALPISRVGGQSLRGSVRPVGAIARIQAFSGAGLVGAIGMLGMIRMHRLIAPIRLIGLIWAARSVEHTSELQSRFDLVCRLLLQKKKAK